MCYKQENLMSIVLSKNKFTPIMGFYDTLKADDEKLF